MTVNRSLGDCKSHQVLRKQLLSTCAQELSSGKRVVAIEAPAGYGKSVFARQLAQQLGYPVVWHSIAPSDNDIVCFIEAFLDHLCVGLPGFDIPELREMLHKGEVKPTEYVRFVKIVTEKLSLSKALFSIVVDDFHLIENPAVACFISDVFFHLPSAVVCLFTSRRPVLLKNNVGLDVNAMLKLNKRDLEFSKLEIIELYQNVLGVNISRSQISSVSESTNGWVMGLMLLEPSLRYPVGDTKYEIDFTKGQQVSDNIAGYFQDNFFDQWPLETLEAFCYLALLDERPVELVNIIIEPIELESLLDCCPFSTLNNGEFILHHLLVDSLRYSLDRILEPESTKSLYGVVTKWYTNNSLPEYAVRYALKAGDTDGAYALLRDAGLKLVVTNRYSMLFSILEMFPKPWPDERAWLWFFDGVVRMYSDPTSALDSLLKANAAMKDDPEGDLVVITSIIQYHFVFDSDFKEMGRCLVRAERLYVKVEKNLPPILKCVAAHNIAVGQLLVHSAIDKVLRYSEEALCIAESLKLKTMRAVIMTVRGLAQAFWGNYPGFIDQVERAKELFICPRVTAEAKVILWLLRLCCCTLCLVDEFSYRREKKLANRQIPDGLPEKTLFIPWVSLLDAQHALGKGDVHSARQHIKSGLETPVVGRLPHYRSILLHYDAIALALDEDYEESKLAAQESATLRVLAGGRFYTYQNQVTCATAAFLRQDYREARLTLDVALPDIRAARDSQYEAAALIPMALCFQCEGYAEPKWLPLLEEALAIMRRQGYMTLWNWTPELMRPALLLAIKHKVEMSYARKLLSERLSLAVTSKGKVIPLMEWHDLGELSITVAGARLIREQQFTATQLRMLSLLYSTPGHRIRFDEIASVLWVDDQGDPRNRVETVISRLRKTLNQRLREIGCSGQSSDYLVTDKQTVRLQNCMLASVRFQRFADQGVKYLSEKKPWQAETAFEQACHHWKGRFMQYIELPDRAYFHQAHLTERYNQVAASLAELLIEAGEHERAMTTAESAFFVDAGHKPTARLLYDLYSRAGQLQKCNAVLKQYRSALQEAGYSEDELVDEIEIFFET